VADVLDYVSSQAQSHFDLYTFGLNAYRRQNQQEVAASRLNRGRTGGGGFAAAQIYSRDRLNPNMTNYSYTYRSTAISPNIPPQPSAAAVTAPASPSAPQVPPPTTVAPPTLSTATTTVRLTNPSRPPIQIVQMEDTDDLTMPLTQNVLSAIMGGLNNQTMTTEFPPTERRFFQLLNMLLPASSTTLNREFLEPVIVRPTEAQINTATITGSVSSETNCAICQDSITPSQEARKILHCEHWFHKDCIDPWFRMNVACPVCRFDIRDHAADVLTRVASPSSEVEDSKTHEN
jgi:hypothetical protein